MSDERSFERFVADNVADGARSVRLPDEFYDDIHAFASRTRQRPEWLALIKEPPMRINSTVGVGSPIARLAIIAATMALIAVLGVGALIAGAQSQGPALSPSPSPSPLSSPTADPMAAAAVTGYLTPDGDGSVVTGQMVTSSDPRLGGVLTYVETKQFFPGDMLVGASRTEIRGDDGAWVGTGTEYFTDTGLETTILAGEGAYAGLTAYLNLDWAQIGRPFTGIIFPGKMPEPPPLP